MIPNQISAVEKIINDAVEGFFEPMTTADMYSFVCAPYREAQESFERELSMMVTADVVAA